MKLVLVEWEDSGIGAHGWTDKRDKAIVNTVSCLSIGVYVGDTEDGKAIRLLSNLNDTACLHGIAIPKGCIKRIRYLKVR